MFKRVNVILNKADELELAVSESKYFLPICFFVSFIGVLIAYVICYFALTMDTSKDMDRVVYSYHNEVYELSSLER